MATLNEREEKPKNFSILNKPPMPRTRSVENIYGEVNAQGMRDAVLGHAKDQVGGLMGGIGKMAATTMSYFGGKPVPETAAPQFDPQQASLIKPDGTTQEGMLAEQNAGFGQMAGANLPDEVLDIGNPYGMSGTLYANLTPPKGYGNAIYSDSKEGAQGFSGGALVKPHGSGPFGRSMATQQKIMERVQAYNNATEMYKSMRGASDAGRRRRELEGRADSNVSLNQGLSSFLSNAANRNNARKDLALLDKRESESADLATTQANADRDFALGLAKLQKPEFKAVDVPYGEVDPISGKQQTRQLLINPMNGQMIDPLQGPGNAETGYDSTSRSAPPEAVAQLKEMLASAASDADKQKVRDSFAELFDLPEGI